MSIFLPFNFNPGQTPITGSADYVVPAGKYAHVTSSATEGDQFIVNGDTILDSAADDVIAFSVSVTGSNNNDTYVVPAGYYAEGNAYASSLGVLTAGVTIIDSRNNAQSFMQFSAAGGVTITAYSGSGTGGSSGAAGYARKTGYQTQGSFWLYAGDVITGGSNMLITLYDIT